MAYFRKILSFADYNQLNRGLNTNMAFVIYLFDPNSRDNPLHKKTMQILSKETTVHSSSYPSPPIPQHLYTETSCKLFFQRNNGPLILHHLLFRPEFSTPLRKNIMNSFSKKTTVHSSSVIYCFDVKFQSVIELLYTKQRQKLIRILSPSK